MPEVKQIRTRIRFLILRTISSNESLRAQFAQGDPWNFKILTSERCAEKWQSYVTLRGAPTYFNLTAQALYYFSRGALLNLPERSGSSNPYNRRILPEPRSTYLGEPVNTISIPAIQIYRVIFPDRSTYLKSKATERYPRNPEGAVLSIAVLSHAAES